MNRLDPAFAKAVDPALLTKLETSKDVAYGVWADLSLAYMNPAWFRFAGLNGAPEEFSHDWRLGSVVLDAFPEALSTFYLFLFQEALAKAPGTSLIHHYDCPSPSIHREYSMLIEPLRAGVGLLVIHHLEEERLIQLNTRLSAQKDVLFTNIDGVVAQCANCRRVKRNTKSEKWDFIPEWVETLPEKVEFSMCNRCSSRFTAELDALMERQA